MSTHIVWHDLAVTKQERYALKGHKGAVIWLTGLSGSGKSTIANAVDYQLHGQSIHSYVLDGDNIRHGLNANLGFSNEDRKENIRRSGEVAKLFAESGQIVMTAFISPFIEDREIARQLFEADEFIEVYVKCPIETCEARDPKGLYRKAREGIIPEFTGISSPYEAPTQPEITIETDVLNIEEAAAKIIQYLRTHHFIQ